MPELIVIGGGLAGSEAAWQAAQQGIQVTLLEMRPAIQTGAHTSGKLGELVCSNSLGSVLIDRAPGLQKIFNSKSKAADHAGKKDKGNDGDGEEITTAAAPSQGNAFGRNKKR